MEKNKEKNALGKTRSDLLQRSVALDNDEETPESASSQAANSAKTISPSLKQEAERASKSIEDLVHNYYDQPNSNPRVKYGYGPGLLERSSASNKYTNTGQIQQATYLEARFKEANSMISAHISKKLSELAGDDLLLAEKLENLLRQTEDSLFYIDEGGYPYKDYSNWWTHQISEESLARLSRNIERTWILHKLDIS